MNAITDLQADDAVLDLIPITCIRPSTTHIQTRRREHFDPAKLLELAASIQQNGVLQPILVRVAPTADELVRYEIVAGERRWRAADRAGLAHVPCVIRDLSDAQVLEAQLVENLQREGLHVLDEAAGYRELLDINPALNAEAIGAKIGRSRSYVYARLKLLDLIPAARDALSAGTLDPSKALILARIHGEKMQARALKLITQDGNGYSYRRLVDKLRNDFMISLEAAPWLPDRDTLHVPKTGDPVPACATCPHNSANDAELAADVDGAWCTDRGCHELKTKWHWHRLRKEAEAAGRSVITGDGVKELLDTRGGYMANSVHNGYVRLDAECDSIEFDEPEPELADDDDGENNPAWQAWSARQENFTAPSYRSLLGEIPNTLLVEGRGGQLVEVAPVAAVAKALKAKGIAVPYNLKPNRGRDDEPPVDPAIEAAERAKEEERRKVEAEYRARLLKAIHAKWKPPLKKHDLEVIAEAMLDGVENSEAFDALYPDRPDTAKMKDADLQRFLVIYAINEDSEVNRWEQHKPARLLDYCQRLKIDAKKIRAEVVKELKPTSAGAEPETKGKGKGAKK